MIEPVPQDENVQTGASEGDRGLNVSTETVVTAAAPERPAWLPESYWDAEANAPKGDDLAARLTRADELEAAEAARKDGVPASAADYKLDLPENVVGLDGQPVRLIADDPATKEAQALAAELGLNQEAFTKLVAFHAGQILQGQKQQADAYQAEMTAELAKLGANGKARIEAVSASLNQHLGDKAQAVLDLMATADAVEGLEALIAKASNPAISAQPQGEAEAKTLAQRMYGS